MGNAIQVNSNVVDTPSGGTIRGTLTATAFSGPLTGNVTGNVTGNLTGNVTGNITSSGESTFTNRLKIQSSDGTPGRIDYYCESSNAHYTRVQAANHSAYSGNVTVTLPVIAGDLIVGDTSSAIDQDINTSGDITAANFIGNGSQLTGIAATDNIRTNTNATFLQNVNVSGTTTATTFIGDLTGDVTGTASNATLAVNAVSYTHLRAHET